jgi:hypothetical protein
MTKIAGSGSVSISQRHGSADPDPYQNVMDPQNCLDLWTLIQEPSRLTQKLPRLTLKLWRLALQPWRVRIYIEVRNRIRICIKGTGRIRIRIKVKSRIQT